VHDAGVLELPSLVPGTVEVELPPLELHGDFHAEFDGIAALQVLRATDLRFVRWVALDDVSRFSLPPGRYLLRLCGAPLAPVAHECEVRAGETVRVVLTTRPAAMRRLAFLHPGTRHPFEPLAIEVRDPGGTVVFTADLPPRDGWWQTELNLERGLHRVTARTRSGLSATTELTIEADDLAPRPLVIALSPDG